jgi:hypothetical protein
LFNLSSSRQFTNTGEGGIWCNSDCGPWFGSEGRGDNRGWGPAFVSQGNNELWAVEPFNGDGKCRSRANLPGYKIVIEGGKNILTNKEDGDFTISELEVWEVVNVENLP